MAKGLELDYEAADKITLLNLQDARKYLKRETEEIQNMADIPEHKLADMAYNIRLINHLDAVIAYYGGG